jgi:hypothetical protein
MYRRAMLNAPRSMLLASLMFILACPGSSGSGGTGGGSSTGGGSQGGGSSTGGGSQGGGSSTGGGGGQGGGSAPDCAAFANGLCTIQQSCLGPVFTLAFEDLATCKLAQTSTCLDSADAGNTGYADPTACLAALTASCDSYFATGQNPPAACQPKHGSVGVDGGCTATGQCASHLVCDTPMLHCAGKCVTTAPAQTPCTFDSDCDVESGLRCVASFDAVNGTDGTSICQMVSYGAANAQCFPGTNKQCAANVGCANMVCLPFLATNATCDPTASLCDTRIGDSCVNNKCTPIAAVHVNAQCGTVGGTTQVCSSYALCDTTTSKCEARVMSGGACTATPDNCWPGLQCMTGTCVKPPPVCP